VKPFPVPPLFQSWFSGSPDPAYLLSGEGAGLADFVAELWLDKLRAEGTTAELNRWTSADVERESLDAAFRTPSFFFRFRVFVLPDLADLKKGPRDAILAYLGAPDPSVILVLPCSDRAAARAFSAVPGVRSAALREEQVVSILARTAVSRIREAGKELSEDAAAFLVRWVGMDFARVKEELAKLISFSADRREIGEEEIRTVCIAGGAVDPFRLAEKLVQRDKKGCLTLFRRFAAGAEAGDFHGLLGAIAWFVRRRLSDKGGALSRDRGGEILTALSRIDRGMKGESRLSPEQLFEIQLLKLLGDGPGRGCRDRPCL
jgi:DNA polymerase III delta subunit